LEEKKPWELFLFFLDLLTALSPNLKAATTRLGIRNLYSPAWPMGLPRQFDFPAGRVGGFWVHGSTGGATGAGFGLLYALFRIAYRVSAVFGPWASASEAEAHTGVAFYALGSCYNKRQKVKSR
jgi:hypothetical protein